MDDDYWLYLNAHAGPRQTQLHRGACHHCRHGQGARTDSSGWHGPYPTVTAAHAAASALGATAWGCKVCRPDTGRRPA